MNSFRYLVPLLLILTAGFLSGQEVKISGSGNGYSGEELRIFSLTDPVTKSLRPVKRVTCDDKGSFLFTVPVNKNGTIYIKSGVYSFYLYVKGGKEYQLKLPNFISRPAGEDQNPFFEEAKVIPEVVSDTSDLNNLIRKFDTEYDVAFNRITDRVAYNVKRSEIPAIIEKLNTLSAADVPQFFSDYVKFRMIMINMVGSGEYSGRVEDSVMINKKFVPDNQAYIDLIEQRFGGYFTTILNGPYRSDFIKAIDTSSADDLKKVLLLDGKAVDEELREYVILLNLYPAYFDGFFPPANIITIMTSISSGGSSVIIRELAATVLGRMIALSPGSQAPEISLKDQAGNLRSAASFRGKFLLLSIARSDNPAVVAEYSILNTWYKKYAADLQVATILTDRVFGKASAKMRSAGFDWTMLDGSEQDLIEYNYNVKMYPTFILIGPDGKIIIASCPFPSENLERTLAVKISSRVQ